MPSDIAREVGNDLSSDSSTARQVSHFEYREATFRHFISNLVRQRIFAGRCEGNVLAHRDCLDWQPDHEGLIGVFNRQELLDLLPRRIFRLAFRFQAGGIDKQKIGVLHLIFIGQCGSLLDGGVILKLGSEAANGIITDIPERQSKFDTSGLQDISYKN